jgi:hypothetical protein
VDEGVPAGRRTGRRDRGRPRRQLVDGIGDHDGFGLRDTSGREQWLAAAYRRTALNEALERLGDPHDKSVRRLFSGLDLAWSAPSRAGDDVDSWADLDD